MNLSREILFFISALGAFNGLLLGVYFIAFRKPKHLSNLFLGALILALSIRTGKSVFFYFYNDLAQIFLHIGLGACALIGPFLYFYLATVLNPSSKVRQRWKYHLLAILPVFIYFCIRYPFYSHLDLWRGYFIPIIYYQWLAYIFLAAWEQWKSIRMDAVGTNTRATSATLKSNPQWWIRSIYFGNIVIWAAYTFCGFGSYILGAVLFSFMLYLLVLLLVFNRKKVALLPADTIKYADKKIDSETATLLLNKLSELMESQELFRNPNLNLATVAEKLEILPHRLSQLLNDNLGKSFPSYINHYRVEAAKSMLQINQNYSLEGIGYECGFNSKSSFYATFKKVTGLTPAKYKAQNSPEL